MHRKKKSNSMVKSKDMARTCLILGYQLSLSQAQQSIKSDQHQTAMRRKWKWKHRIASISKIGSIV